MRGKDIDYSANAINHLLNFQPPPVCALKTYRNEQCVINEAIFQEMLDALCRPEIQWVIECGLALRLKIIEFRPSPRAWASFFVQTLEPASNQS